ncbi:hypothetical protein NW762_006402 [Fusarium torreyae]|uniref:Apopolysialoglycoprotein n=1 Tax=Fusarium torreyae TaxID=1237075 RepID=A0A9W8S3V3_9HYPO|nr:hypothetical protein NW762_006402 [Fusarium torreyae]
MAPGTRRANRAGYAEHDDFEGLPVRQWRQEWINVAPPQQQEQTQQNDIWSIELLHGMPKDSNLLPTHSQELLAAARSGRLYKRPAPAEEEEADADAAPEKPEKKEEDTSAKGFSVKVWKQLPRNVDTPATSHLAKRQKNTVTIASRTVEEKVQGPTVTKATVRRIDAAGNPYTEEVTLSDGQQVRGEIVSTRIEAAPVPGAEPTATTPVPNRRRPPPPKRKAKAGPGRGKKKNKNPPPEAGAPGPAAAPTGDANGATPAAPIKPENPAEAAIKQEREDSANQDSPMPDADDDDDDEDGDDDDGEEGEDGEGTPAADSQGNRENNKSQDHEMTDAAPPTTTDTAPVPPPAPALPPASPPAALGVNEPDVMQDDLPAPTQQNPANLAPAPPTLTPGESRLEGSPLKNVVMPSPSAEEKLLQEAISAPFAEGDKPQEPESTKPQEPGLTEENLAQASLSPPHKDNEPHASGVDEEKFLMAAINAPFGPGQAPAVGPGAEPAESTLAEPPSTVVGEAPEAATDRDVPMLEPTDSEALLPPPPEEVGNIATTPPGSSGGPNASVTGSDGKPPTDIQAGEEAAPQRPPLAQNDTGLTEDSIKPDDSASITAPISDITDVPAAAPPSVTEPPPEPPAETTVQEPPAEKTKSPTPPQPDNKEGSLQPEIKEKSLEPENIEESVAPADEPVAFEDRPSLLDRTGSPDLLGGLIDRYQADEVDSDIRGLDDVPAMPLPEKTPEAPAEAISEPAANPVPEPAAQSAPEPSAETAAEPSTETIAEPVSEAPPEPALIPSEPPAGPVDEPVDEPVAAEEVKPEEPAPEVPVAEAPATPEPAVVEGEMKEEQP